MHPGAWQRRLFPEEPRNFPGRRILRSALRTLHILGGGVLIGGYLFFQPQTVVQSWFLIASLSGLLLFATDLHASLAILFEWRGLSIVAKIILLLMLPFLPGLEVPILILILTIGAFSSHLSRKFRHRLWWRLNGVKSDQRHG